MAIDFTGANGQNITFAAIPSIDNLVDKTIVLNVNLDNLTDLDMIISKRPPALNAGWFIDTGEPGGNLEFFQEFSTSIGWWYINSAIVADTNYHVAVTYNNSSASNDPLIYINGLSVPITEYATPAGTAVAETTPLEIGGESSLANSTIDGYVQNVRIYNRILTPAEIYTLYVNRRINFPLSNGLVFHAPMIGAAGLTKFDGSTLGATNYVWDVVNNAAGTPVGNPVGAGNTIQRIN